MRQQLLAGFGQRDAAAVAVQQRLAQLHLQRPHLARQRRLRHLQVGRRTREAAHLGHVHEVFELLQIHADDGIAASGAIALMTDRRCPTMRRSRTQGVTPMIIDIHGHYTTAPKALEAWRNAQIAGIQDPRRCRVWPT
jgi:hypothetical protein